jgi:hypothetical protein
MALRDRLTVFVRPSRTGLVPRHALRLACIMALALLATSCTDTGSGYNLQGVNNSSKDVIVTIGTSSGGSFLLPSKSWGTISVGVSRPTGDIVVSDQVCNLMSRVPWTEENSTLEIASDGSIRLTEFNRTFPLDVQPLSHVEGGPLSSIRTC